MSASTYGDYAGPVFVGRVRLRYRWRDVRVAMLVLWHALCGFSLAGYAHSPNHEPPTIAGK